MYVVMDNIINLGDYELGGSVWRVGAVGERVCLVVPLGMGSVWEKSMRRFKGWQLEYARSETTDKMARLIEEFLHGDIRAFPNIQLLVGSAFERLVWTELMRVGYGERVSYGELARRCGRPEASRAVGNAVGRNPLLLVVPCHRVVAADGTIGGFSAGIALKERLLKIECGVR